MSKKTEIVKSIALTVLVAMSIVLFANSWVREWSHSDSENDSALRRFLAWAGVESWFGMGGEILPGTDIVAPASVVSTSGAKRIITNKGTDMYSSVYEDILSLLLFAENPAAVSETNTDEWYYAQKNQCIYLDYGVTLKRTVLEAGIGVDLPDVITAADSVLLTSNDSATNKLVIYFHDPSAEKYFKLLTDKSAKAVGQILTGLRGYENIPLAVELGFNTTPEEGYGQQLVIYGNNIIDLEGSSEKVPKYRRIKNVDEMLDNRQLSKLLALFDMSESSAKQYADMDGASMYIDANATLRFYEDEQGAVMEYAAASSMRGVSFTNADSSADVMYSITCGAYSQVHSVMELFSTDNVTLRIASDVTGTYGDSGEIQLYIDCCYNGIPIFFESEGRGNHVAELRFNSSGNLVYFKQKLFHIDASNRTEMQYPPVMNAIDKVYSIRETSGKTMYIEDIFKSYRLKEEAFSPVWCIRLKNDGNVYLID